MRFNWLRGKPDPQLEALKEKVARADQAIEAGDHVLQQAIKHTNGAFVRLEKRTAVVKQRLSFDDQVMSLFGRSSP